MNTTMESEQNQEEVLRLSQHDDASKDKAKESPEGRKPLKFEEVVTPEHLKIIAQASGGFTFRPDPNLPPERVGYTNMQTKEIRYNPQITETWDKRRIRGFTYHEAGHHAPEVLELDNKLTATLRNPEIIPPAFRGDPQAEARFLRSLSSNLHNALLDIWLEKFMSRRPYYGVRQDIQEMNVGMGEHPTYRQMPKPEQFIQALLSIRYRPDQNMQEKLDPDVHASFKKMFDSKAMSAIEDKSVYENYFSSPADKQRASQRKMTAYEQIILPEYLKLMEAELDKRKKERQEQNKQQSGQPEPGQGGQPSSDPVSESVPLTQEEEKELIEQVLNEMEEYGKQMESAAPSDEEEKQKSQMFDQISKMLKERKERIEKGEKPEPFQQAEPKGKSGEDAVKDAAKQFQKRDQEKARQGLAESMGVRQESVQEWQKVREQSKIEIDSLASNLAEIFLDDRRKRLDYLRREGEIIPGLEYETVVAILSGQADPETKMKEIQNPEFLETEIEFVVDTSGSMMGQKIEESIRMMVIIVEAYKKVIEDLRNENLLMEDESPFRIGVTKFTTQSERVSKLDEPLDDRKELQIIDKVSMVGGGTDEAEAITQAHEALKLGKNNVIKMIMTLTDGAGNVEGVRPIIQQIERDDEVIFLAVGLGEGEGQGEQIVGTYLDPLKSREANVFGIAANNPKEILPKILEFIKREVDKRRRRY